MVILSEGIGEASGYLGILPLLPERYDHKFLALWAAHVHDVGPLEVPNQQRAPFPVDNSASGVSLGHAGGNLRLLAQRAAHALTKPLRRVISHCDKHVGKTIPATRTL